MRRMTQGGRERAGLVSFARSLDFIPRAKGSGKGLKLGKLGGGRSTACSGLGRGWQQPDQ